MSKLNLNRLWIIIILAAVVTACGMQGTSKAMGDDTEETSAVDSAKVIETLAEQPIEDTREFIERFFTDSTFRVSRYLDTLIVYISDRIETNDSIYWIETIEKYVGADIDKMAVGLRDWRNEENCGNCLSSQNDSCFVEIVGVDGSDVFWYVGFVKKDNKWWFSEVTVR